MVRFEWDEQKNQRNLDKHGIGSVEGLVLLAVVHTYREAEPDHFIRIISARRATRHERKLYEAAHS